MLNDSAVEAQPWASSSAASDQPSSPTPAAAELGRDVEPVEAGVTQRGVVLDGVAGLAIVLGGARGEVGGETAGALLQIPLRRT